VGGWSKRVVAGEKVEHETCEFICIDPSGAKIKVIGEREVVVKYGLWTFRTEKNDWRVRQGSSPGDYVLIPGNIPLTTSDPRAPKD
jgi:hypothetical protein